MRSPRVGIVGAGISGICLGVLMLESGFETFTIYEEADDVGGVWRDNRYPGLQCDVPSRLYSFRFAPNPDWTRMYAQGPEIHKYLRKVADDFGVRPYIRFGTKVACTRWTGDVWEVIDTSGRVEEYDFVVSATGLLHVPNVPSIPGLGSFHGELRHTALWEDVELKDRRVAVIGTGSSGVQIVAEIADEVRELVHICRTPQWIMPGPNRVYTGFNKSMVRRFPPLLKAVSLFQLWFYNKLSEGMMKPIWSRKLIDFAAKTNLRRVKNPSLRAALTPDYPVGCKRAPHSNAYYRVIQQPHVKFVAGSIEHIDATGITTADGVHHEVDVIILATGFQFSKMPHEVIGEQGQPLEEVWAQSPKTYRTVAVAGFPNFFFIAGAVQPITSLYWVAEVQARYIIQWLEMYRDGKVDRTVVRQEAQDRFQARLDATYPDTSYASGCQSYYLSADGTPRVLTIVWREFIDLLREPEIEDYASVGSKATG